MDLVLKSADIVVTLTNQALTLSTAILGLSVTLAQNLLRPEARKLMRMVWGAHILSLVFGIWTLGAVAGELEGASRPCAVQKDSPAALTKAGGDCVAGGVGTSAHRLPSLRSRHIRIPSALQLISFVCGTGLLVVAATRVRGPEHP
jgi:hypothetical protein